MKKLLLSFAFLIFLFPSVSSASGLTQNQVDSIVNLLRAFNAPQATLERVWSILESKVLAQAAQTASVVPYTPTAPAPTPVATGPSAGDIALRQQQHQQIIDSCNSQQAAITQKIIDIKNQYYRDIAGYESGGGWSLEFAQGMEAKALSDANMKISVLQTQSQQVALTCQNQLNQYPLY